MRYIDSGSRNRDQTLASWLRRELTPDIVELRWQSGFFSADSLGLIAPAMERLRDADRVARMLIGSNDPGTLRDDVLQLMELAGIPRQNGALGVVRYGNAFYHPKTYHIRRTDGSQAAYVGSSNLTVQGLALHVEAGILLESRDGDSGEVLDDIAAKIDAWFADQPAGFRLVPNLAAIDQLVEEGVLLLAPPPPRSRNNGGGSTVASGGSTQARLRPLIELPRFARAGAIATSASVPEFAELLPETEAVTPPVLAVTPRAEFPQYLLFDPEATSPTTGAGALSGATLPNNSPGIIIRLNRDSARHFSGRPGTANISIPVATISTLRFGLFQGKFMRPRAEFDLLLRYVGQTQTIVGASAATNIMAYGFAPGEKGHGDIRMLVPADVRTVAQQVQLAGMSVPADGNFAILEWPTSINPQFRLTFLEPASTLHRQASSLFTAAESSSQLVGDGACWLPAGMSPAW